MRATGRLVAVEGIDGAGKSTLVRALQGQLTERGFETVTVTRYMVPELTALWHRLVRSGAVEQRSAATLAAADHVVGLERTIRPALERGHVVVTDRYVYSHLVYFSVRGVDRDRLRVLFDGAMEPGCVLYLDVSPEEAADRLEAQGKPDFWEAGLDYRLGLGIGRAHLEWQTSAPSRRALREHFVAHQQTALEKFREVLPRERTVCLDGTLRPDELLRSAAAAIEPLLLAVRHRQGRPSVHEPESTVPG